MKFLLLWFFALNATAGELWLKVGEVRSLPAESGKAVRVGSHGIVKVIDGEDHVRVVGLKPGITPLVIGPNSYSVHVTLSQQKEFTQAVRASVHEMMGLSLNTDAQPLAIDGTLLRFSDWQRLAVLSRRYHGEYAFRAQALPDVAETALAFLSKLARDKGYPIVRFRSDPQFTAQVPAAAGQLRENVTDLFQPYGIRVVAQESQLMIQPLVRTKVILAEVSKDNSLELGVEWPSEYKAQILPRLSAGEDSVMVSLKALEARGQAQILAAPTLLCRSGGEATFHAGGEFPIRMASRLFHDVIWKEHGVLLSVRPQADFQGAISLELETEVSVLDTGNAVQGIPALKTNTVQSHFDLPGKRTIALSGLVRQDMGESKEGVPLLNRIPILGALFSSQKFIKHQTELVIFVTPEIYVPEGDEKMEMPQGWVKFDG